MNDKIPDAQDETSDLPSRREFIRKAAYASPVLLTLPAVPSFAQQGSGAGSGDPGADFLKFQACLLKLDLFHLSIRIVIHDPHKGSVLAVRCFPFFFLAVPPI